jgi:hypothetical protein
MHSRFAFAVALLLSLFADAGDAQVALLATTQLIPVVASTASFVSDISIVNAANNTPLTINMTFYEAETSSTPGPKVCTPVNVPADGALTVRLAGVNGQCTLGAGNHHGFVILSDASPAKEGLFAAYSRVSNPQGIGFSVEGFPIGHIGGGEEFSGVPALKRAAATAQTPAYQSNCFVATLDDAVDYTIHVYAGGGDYTITGSLQPYQMRRYLDIFAAAGVPAGDLSDVVVGFEKTTQAQVKNTLLAFCTVQDNTSFGADFRIARTDYGGDWSRLRLVCQGINYDANANDCTTLKASPNTLQSAGTKADFLTMFYAPDTVNCRLVSPQLANLEMRLVLANPYTVLAGGDNQNSFSFFTGPRSAINNGVHTFYLIEVGPREGTSPSYPIQYGIRCFAGNGMLAPVPIRTPPDDF